MAASLLTVLAFAAGLALITTGVWARYGTPWGLITGGIIVTAVTVGYARGA